MGMAYQAPKDSREFHYHVTDHALERFRERVDEERRALPDRSLGLLLDERLWDAYQAKKFVEVVDRDRPTERTWIFEIEARSSRKNFVVMRRYHPGARPALPIMNGTIGCSLAAITVLTSEMAAANYANGLWRVPNTVMAEKLAGIKAAPPAPPSVNMPSADSPPPKESEPAEPETAARPRVSLVEKFRYAKEVLRERPNISALGKDGLSELVRERFGVGMSWETITRLREEVAEEQVTAKAMGGMISPAANYPATGLSNAAALASRSTVVPEDREPSVAEQLTLAIAAEKKAKWSRDQAQVDLEACTALVDQLMAALRASRE